MEAGNDDLLAVEAVGDASKGRPHAMSSVSTAAAVRRNSVVGDKDGDGVRKVVGFEGGSSAGPHRPSTAGSIRPAARPSTATERGGNDNARPTLRKRPLSALPANDIAHTRPYVPVGSSYKINRRDMNEIRPASALSRLSTSRARPPSSMSRQSWRSSGSQASQGEYVAPRSKMMVFDSINAKLIDHSRTHRVLAKQREQDRRSRPQSAASSYSTSNIRPKWPAFLHGRWNTEKSEDLFREAYSQPIQGFYMRDKGWGGKKELVKIPPAKREVDRYALRRQRKLMDPQNADSYNDWLKHLQVNLEREMDERGELEEHMEAARWEKRNLKEMYEEMSLAASMSEEQLQKNLRKTFRVAQSKQPGHHAMEAFGDEDDD